MGAYIAIMLAVDNPELINSIIMVDGGGIPHALLSPEALKHIVAEVLAFLTYAFMNKRIILIEQNIRIVINHEKAKYCLLIYNSGTIDS